MNINSLKNRFGIIGHSPKLLKAIEIAAQVAPTDVNVLVMGENGTGKDVFSKLIYQFSNRRHQKFIAINCGAIPEGTMDSELFGHEKGSFTSAYETRKGYFEEVDNGTIFLDEIGEMPKATQSRLLRLLESGEYLRVGSSKIQEADVRVVAATNQNLVEMIRKGRFREDLFFRLNTVSIMIPPLRERGTDVELLFTYFAGEFAEKYNKAPLILNTPSADVLYEYRWPGNIRELRNFVEKLTVLVRDSELQPDIIRENLMLGESTLPTLTSFESDNNNSRSNEPNTELLLKLIFDLRKEVGELKNMFFMGIKNSGVVPEEEIIIPHAHSISPKFGLSTSKPNPVSPPSTPLLPESLSLEKKEKELITRALDKFQNNRKKAAKALGISERTLYRKIKHYDIQ